MATGFTEVHDFRVFSITWHGLEYTVPRLRQAGQVQGPLSAMIGLALALLVWIRAPTSTICSSLPYTLTSPTLVYLPSLTAPTMPLGLACLQEGLGRCAPVPTAQDLARMLEVSPASHVAHVQVSAGPRPACTHACMALLPTWPTWGHDGQSAGWPGPAGRREDS